MFLSRVKKKKHAAVFGTHSSALDSYHRKERIVKAGFSLVALIWVTLTLLHTPRNSSPFRMMKKNFLMSKSVTFYKS